MKKAPKPLHFYKLIFAYDGSRFAGSAKQPQVLAVQDALDAALAKLGALKILGANYAISQFASRTDKGVHALCNVAKVCFAYEIDAQYAINKINSSCPGIWLRAICKCSKDFQPRFDAKLRSYRYVLKLTSGHITQFADANVNLSALKKRNLCALKELDSLQFCIPKHAIYHKNQAFSERKNNAFAGFYCAKLPEACDIAAFIKAAKLLKGEHDFKALCLNAKEHASTIKYIDKIRVYFVDDLLVFNIFSSGFLRGQIRLIIGILLALARGKITQKQFVQQLNASAVHYRLSASAAGLYLKSISY